MSLSVCLCVCYQIYKSGCMCLVVLEVVLYLLITTFWQYERMRVWCSWWMHVFWELSVSQWCVWRKKQNKQVLFIVINLTAWRRHDVTRLSFFYSSRFEIISWGSSFIYFILFCVLSSVLWCMYTTYCQKKKYYQKKTKKKPNVNKTYFGQQENGSYHT